MSQFDEAQYKAIVARFEKGNERLISDFNAAVSRIQEKFSHVPFVGTAVERSLGEAKNIFDGLLRQQEAIIEWAGMPIQLALLRNSWDTATEQLNTARNSMYRLGSHLDEWNGIAGGSYKGAVLEQPKAMDKIRAITEQMANACDDASTAGFIFMIAALNAMQSLIGALATAETGVGLVAGLADFAVSVAAAYASLKFGVDPQTRAIYQIYDDNHGYFTPGWPKSARF